MNAFRLVLLGATVLATLASPLFPRSTARESADPAVGSLLSAATVLADAENDNGNNNGNKNGNGNGNSNGNGNGNSNENGNDNESDGSLTPVAPAPAPSAPNCARAGQGGVFSSADGRIAVRVFGSMPQDLAISITMVTPGTVPATPGQLVDQLVFRLQAQGCGGEPRPANLPAEVNLGVRYSDADAAGLNEQSFTLALLDPTANTWAPAAKQASDPAANYASATIANTGTYALYQR